VSGRDEVFDPGLQPERTFLAWQRTVLALAVASAAAVRYAAPQLGLVSAFVGLAGLGLALAAYIGVRFRYRRTHDELTESGTLRAVSAWPLAAIGGSVIMLGIAAVLYLTVGHNQQ
jgi:putative membrane protein